MITEFIHVKTVSNHDAHNTQTNLPHCVTELMSGLLDWLGQLKHTERCSRVFKHTCARGVHMCLQLLIWVFLLYVCMHVHMYHVCAVCAQRC